MRVLVYNVRGFRAGSSRIAAAVRDLRPDVALVTECGTTRSLREFAGALGMDAHHASLVPIVRRARNAVLVRKPLKVERTEAHYFKKSARFHPRGAFVAEVVAGTRRFTAIAVHLGLSGQERQRHARELMSLVGSLGSPVLVGGDFNERPKGPAALEVAGIGWDAWARVAGDDAGATFPAKDPAARIDYLVTSRAVRIEAAFVPQGADLKEASDHLPLVVDLVL